VEVSRAVIRDTQLTWSGGGLRGTAPATEKSPSRRIRTREVKGIDANVRLNRSLWTLAEKFAALKTGKPLNVPVLATAEVN
jgi:hypothetical protein